MEVVEIYYEVGQVADAESLTQALDFRNAAINHIEAALLEENLGYWSDAELLVPYVTFAFTVTDAAKAEAVIRAVVDGTPYEGIDRLTRREMDD